MVLEMSLSEDSRQSTTHWASNKKMISYAFISLFFFILTMVVLTSLFYANTYNGNVVLPNVTRPPLASPSTLHVFKKAAVCADGSQCAEIGKQILLQNGSAVDATIATLFCNGLVNMQSMGIGGGFLMTIFKKSEGKAYSLNARETAPLAVTADIFAHNADAAKKGGLSIGIPGELRGYWAAHQKFGRLPWKDLVSPAISLCNSGFRISIAQKKAMNMTRINPPTGLLKNWFYGDDSQAKQIGDIVKPKHLCNTLRVIAELGADEFYTGNLSKLILEDLKKAGSLISAEDLRAYEPKWQMPIAIELRGGQRLYSAPPPGSGVLLAYILKMLDGYRLNRQSIDGVNNTVLTYHRMVEVFKYAYAKRTQLGDPDYVNIEKLISDLTSPSYAESTRKLISDYGTSKSPTRYGAVYFDESGQNGTAHVSVLSSEGDAVSVTSTINLYFGSEVVSEQTGILFNCVMDDFSTPGIFNYFGLPGSPNNAIEPGKRPLSSMSPSILVDQHGDVHLVIGASGGTQITTGVAQVISRLLWFDQNIKEAVDAPRIHHQLFPMSLDYEYGTMQQILDGLERLGHNTSRLTSYSVVCALMKQNNLIYANADHRKGGDVYGIN